MFSVAQEVAIQYDGLFLRTTRYLKQFNWSTNHSNEPSGNIQVLVSTNLSRARGSRTEHEYILIVCPTKEVTEKRLQGHSHKLQRGNCFGPIQSSWTRLTLGPDTFMSYLRQSKIFLLPATCSNLLPTSRFDECLEISRWDLGHTENNNDSVQSFIIGGVLTLALWSSGVILVQEDLNENLNWLLDSRLETAGMFSPKVQMTPRGNGCLRALTDKDIGPLSGLSTETVENMSLKPNDR